MPALWQANANHGLTFTVAGDGAALAASLISENGAVVLGAGMAAGMRSGVFMCAVVFIPLHDKPNFVGRSLIASLALSLLPEKLGAIGVPCAPMLATLWWMKRSRTCLEFAP